MKRPLGLLVVVGLLVAAPGWALAGGKAVQGTHRGTGVVVVLSPSEIALLEGEGLHRMTINQGTRIRIGAEDRVYRLGIGDYVAEECVPDGTGGVTAVRLTLYRPAWMENASPEN